MLEWKRNWRNDSMNDRYSKIENYSKMRDAAVVAAVEHGDLVPLKRLISEYGLPDASSDEVLLCTAHKMCCNITTISEKLQEKSRKWLEDQGFSEDIGG